MSVPVLFVVALIAPFIIVALVCLILVPKLGGWRRKLWELNTGELGLCLAVASTFMITNGMKQLFGKPRPNLLARCDPDLRNISTYAVGGFGNISQGVYLVTSAICRTQGDLLDEGFRSFPSGHSSCEPVKSFAGFGLCTDNHSLQSPPPVLHT